MVLLHREQVLPIQIPICYCSLLWYPGCACICKIKNPITRSIVYNTKITRHVDITRIARCQIDITLVLTTRIVVYHDSVECCSSHFPYFINNISKASESD